MINESPPKLIELFNKNLSRIINFNGGINTEIVQQVSVNQSGSEYLHQLV